MTSNIFNYIIILFVIIIIIIYIIIFITYYKQNIDNFIGNATPITKIEPEPYNYRNSHNIINNDIGFLRNYRAPLPYSLSNELSYSEIYRALQTIFPIGSSDTLKSSSLIDKFDDNLYIYSAIKTAILTKFNSYMILTPTNNTITNNKIKPDEMVERYHPYSFYKATNSLLVEFNRDEMPNILLFYLMFGRENKMYLFTVYFSLDIKIDIANNNIIYTYNTVETTGITNNDILGFKPDNMANNMPDNIDNNNIDNDKTDKKNEVIGIDRNLFNNMENLKEFEPHLMNNANDMPAEIFLPEYQKAKIEEKRIEIAKGSQEDKKKCFGLIEDTIKNVENKLIPENRILPQYSNKLFCESYHPEINQIGLWDAPCQVDTDCPFYQANKNYDNELGKCDKGSGFCEMPLGIIPYGYTHFGKGGEPVCYSDNQGTEKCSEQWGKIKDKIVKYDTPDYIFLNDNELRRSNKNLLENKGLFANPSI